MASERREELQFPMIRKLTKCPRFQFQIRIYTCIWILQGIDDALFQCYILVAISDGKVSPKVWWISLSQMAHACIWSKLFSWYLWWDSALGIGQLSCILLSHEKIIFDILVYLIFGKASHTLDMMYLLDELILILLIMIVISMITMT